MLSFALIFFSMLQTMLGFPHFLVFSLTHCICGQLLDPMGIHLFRCANGGERTTSHDVVQDVFAYIMKDTRFHVLWEQTHIFLQPSLQSFYWQVDIVLSIDGIHTLVDVVITDFIQTYLVSQVALSCEVAVIVMTQMKEGLHCDHYTSGSFLWGGCDSDDSSEGRTSLRPLPNRHVFFSHHKGLWVSSLVVGELFSLMC